MNRISLVPVGGLANRLRTLASALVLAEETNSHLDVYWFRDWALNAPFHALFNPIPNERIHSHECSTVHLFTLDRPRRKNFFFPHIYQSMAFSASIYEESVAALVDKGFDFADWVNRYGHVYIASYMPLVPFSDSLLRQSFIPISEVMEEINLRTSAFTSQTIGVHVRRTDNIASIEKSPLDAFYDRIDACPGRPNIFLATDSDEVKRQMLQRYHGRIITSMHTADRNSINGIREGIIDIFMLSRTSYIYGSFHSTFSIMAAQLGGIPLEVVEC